MLQIGVFFLSSTSRVVYYRMIDWKKALNWPWIIEWKALKSLEFFIVFWCRNPERTPIIRDAGTSVIDLTVALTRSAASAWWGYAHASDRSRLEAVLRRRKRSGLCSGDVITTAVRISCATLYCQVRGAVGWPVVVGRLGGGAPGAYRRSVSRCCLWPYLERQYSSAGSAAVGSVLLAELFSGSGI